MATTEFKNPTDFTPGPKGDTGKEGNDRAVSELEAKLVEMFESGNMQEALDWISKLHNYSLWNRLLIAVSYAQRGYEGPMHVAGMKAWDLKFKRRVKKGSKAVWIFAPIFSYKDARDDNGNPVIVKGKVKRVKDRLVGYKVVPVFAVQDTEGEPVPELVMPPLVETTDNGPEASKLLARLIDHSEGMGVPVKVAAKGEDVHLDGNEAVHGYYHKIEKRIVLRSSAAAGHLAMVMAHELAHHVAHEQERKLGWDVGAYADHEIVAQATAYVVCDRLGIDVTGFTLPYVAGWGRDIGRIRRALWFVGKVTDGVLPADPQDATDTAAEKAEQVTA